jgi:hypothetical protein
MAQDFMITGQRHTTVINDSGQLTQVMEVTFRTVPPAGSTAAPVTAHVDVPLSQYPAQAIPMVQAFVTGINQVAGS